MKQLILSICFVCSFFAVLSAQNVQLHYDFGRTLYNKDSFDGRPLLVSTIENFKADRWGSTYFFVDMFYSSKGVQSAYTEISRQLKFWDAPVAWHLEYNGGLANKFSFNNAYLTGATYTYNNADFSKGFGLSLLYKYIQKHKSPHSFQVTGTWYINFSDDLFTFSGFADLWREEKEHGMLVFLSEPQFWVNLNRLQGFADDFNLSLGGELKLSHNFEPENGFFAIPTLAVKWTF